MVIQCVLVDYTHRREHLGEQLRWKLVNTRRSSVTPEDALGDLLSFVDVAAMSYDEERVFTYPSHDPVAHEIVAIRSTVY